MRKNLLIGALSLALALTVTGCRNNVDNIRPSNTDRPNVGTPGPTHTPGPAPTHSPGPTGTPGPMGTGAPNPTGNNERGYTR